MARPESQVDEGKMCHGVRVPYGDCDPTLESICRLLSRYSEQHPGSRCEAYRRNPWSIRILVEDPGVETLDSWVRTDRVWDLIDDLSEEVLMEVSLLIVVTPKERAADINAVEFDHPLPAAG